MIRDLRTIIDGWDYEPGKVSVRKIIGRDGRERIQTRIDLGVLQIEPTGRPDGQRPFGCTSLIEYHERRLAEHNRIYGGDDDFVLTPEQCRELRHEAYLYYQRYLSEFVLEDFAAVENDTARTLRIIALSERYAGSDADRGSLRSQFGYVVMMNTRARVYRLLAEGAPSAAVDALKAGLATLERAAAEAATHDGAVVESEGPLYAGEQRVLGELYAELLAKLPPDSAPRLQHELAEALAIEDYEKAAELRDRLQQLQQRESKLSRAKRP